MKDKNKEQLANEPEKIRQRIAQLEKEVADRRQSEEELQKSELRYRLLAENVTDVIWTMDMNLQFTYISPSVKRRYGYSVEEALAIPIEESLTPSSFKDAMKVFKEEMAIEKMEKKDLFRPRTLEVEQYRKDGSTVWSELEIAFLRDADGQAIGIVGVARDITDRKRAEEELRDSEERFRSLVENAPYIIFIADREGKILFANYTLAGFTVEDTVGTSVFDYVTAEHREEMSRNINGVFESGEPASYEIPGAGPDGTTSWYSTRVGPIKHDGHIIAVTLMVLDITERKRAEEELRKSEEKYRLLLDNLIEPVTVYDFKGLILLINVTGAKNLGSIPEDVVGKSLYDFFPDTADVYVERARRIFESGVGLEFEDEVPLTSGKRWFYSNIQPIKDISGKVVAVHNISYDITERKRAEEALQKSEERYRTVLDTIEEGYFEVDLAGNFTFSNDSLCRIIGCPRDEMMGTNNRQYMDDDIAKAVYEVFNNVYRTGEPARAFGWEVIRKDGIRIFVEASISLMRGPSGEPVGFRGIIRDITERKRAEEELKKSEEKLRVMFEAITDGIVVTDLQGIITEVNDVIVHMSGLSREEIIGHDGFALLPREDRDKIVEEGKRVIKENTGPGRRDYEVSPTVGIASTTNLILGTMHDSDGNPTGFVAIAQDITERKRMEEALQKSEEKYRNLFEGASDGIFTMELTDEGVLFMDCNSKALTIFGCNLEEIIGKSPLDFSPPVQPDGRASEEKVIELASAIIAGEQKFFEWSHRRLDGTTFEVEVALNQIDIGGRIHMQAIVRDITERKRAEQERERLVEELEDKSEELEQLVFIASHDLRSPLVNIQGFAREIEQSLQEVRLSLEEEDIPSALKEKLASPIGEDITDSLNYILTSSSKIDSMLAGLLKVSRLGKVSLTIEKINMKDLMAEVMDSFEFQTREAGVKLEVGRLPQCRGDRAQLNQVFSNLIDNALKFFDPERPGIIRISGRKEDRQAVYTVEDNGIGIAPENQKTVFQIFRRFAPMDTPGEGLGLNIVRRILDRHGGKIWLESEQGKGSRFHVSLPIR